jgi:hypothetical protein
MRQDKQLQGNASCKEDISRVGRRLLTSSLAAGALALTLAASFSPAVALADTTSAETAETSSQATSESQEDSATVSDGHDDHHVRRDGYGDRDDRDDRDDRRDGLGPGGGRAERRRRHAGNREALSQQRHPRLRRERDGHRSGRLDHHPAHGGPGHAHRKPGEHAHRLVHELRSYTPDYLPGAATPCRTPTWSSTRCGRRR